MLEAVLSDFLQSAGLPAANTLAALPIRTVGAFLARKAEEKREIILNEIRNGNLGPEQISSDEFISSAWRLHIAIIQGESAQNIRLFSKILVGLVNSDQPTYADKFLHYSATLEGLSIEELIVLASFHRNKQLYAQDIANGITEPPSVMHRVRVELVSENGPFESEDEFSSHCISVCRTGLLIPQSGWGGIVYDTTPKLDELVRLINQNLSDLLE